MQIEWWTLAIQAVNFLLLVWLLRRFLYRPVREVIEKRRALSEAAFAAVAAKEAEVAVLKEKVEAERAAMAAERQAMLKRLHEEAAAERDNALDRAAAEARKLTEDARAMIGKERQAALHDLQEQAADLAVGLAGQLLAQIETDVPADVYLAKLEAQLKGLPAAGQEELKADLAGQDAALAVVTARPLSAELQDRWRTRLAGVLGLSVAVAFETDPAIVGGAEARFPHNTLKLTWADRLQKARTALLDDKAAS